ncbi:uncharacterized protein LOC124314250 [Daphnia pulicaria]|uniref:uncharacterized protein LOC124314250 n=1 Tax=Daphnia pulicaria TaxID=35523 RepID=UPI001EEB2B23|nr:uncharacterized protein LOC124314250 [Daphnia pulicaria]
MTSLNLLVGYGSDSSESSGTETKESTQTELAEDPVKSKIENNFFQVFDDSSSGEENDQADNFLLQDEHLKNLKNPFRSSETSVSGKSVFANPYKEAEDAEKGTLEKHVKFTPKLEDIKEINGRKICWNYRKGRCRFGSNCVFAHDSELLQKKQNQEINQQSVSSSADFDQDSVITSQTTSHATKRPISATSQSCYTAKKGKGA